jgi:hypothetical protein
MLSEPEKQPYYIFICSQVTNIYFYFFQEKPDYEMRKNLVKGLLQEHGSQLVHALINACLFCLPTFMTADIGEVLYELMIVDRPVSNHGNRYFVIAVNCKLYKFPLLVDTFVVFLTQIVPLLYTFKIYFDLDTVLFVFISRK